jgi:hypothetical protein
MSQEYVNILNTTENLQYFSGSVTFTDTTKTMAATGIHTGFSTGDRIVVAGSVNNNGTFTIATLGTNSLTVNETVVTEGPVASTLTQEVTSLWHNVTHYSRLVGVYSTSGNANLYCDFSIDGANTLVTLTTAITASTPAAYAQEIVAPYARLRLRTNAADQTSVAVHVYAKTNT